MSGWVVMTAMRRVALAVVLVVVAAFVCLIPAPQAALAVSQGALSISAGGDSACAIDSGGQAYCWGDNDEGQLGDGTTQNSDVPVPVDTSGVLAGKTLTQISVGSDGDTCALDSTGAAYCWGDNQLGALGDGSMTPAYSSVPVAVDTSGVLAGKTLTQISTGDVHSCALDSTGAAYCWGDNGLGDGSTQDSDTPVAVGTSGVLAGKTLAQVSAGESVTCALDTAGAAYCWGDGADGVLGDGSYSGADALTPVAVDTSGALAGKTLVQISAGGQFRACALDSTGAAYCWGDGQDGALGTGSSGESDVPLPVDTGGVLAGKTLTQISAGDGFSACALDDAGAAYCWGYNHDGELGDHSSGQSDVPVAVYTSGALAGKTLTQISVSGQDVCSLDAAGAIYCWGYNGDGELGNNHTGTSRHIPVLTGPHAPYHVTAAASNTAAKVSWKRPARLDGGTITGYTATALPGQATCSTDGATKCTITGLTNGTTYQVSVTVQTTAGNSGASIPATVTPEARHRA
jgi:alpha-tubulin suppressor-like RCC1 family protein